MTKSEESNWKLLKSRIVFDNYTKIVERTYKMPDGQIKNYYIKTVAHPAVCVLALTTDNKFIVAEEFRPGPNTVLNELPGGGMEANETPEEGAARELLEETGYSGDLELITEMFDDAYTDIRRYAFVATNCRKVAPQKLDDSEFIKVRLLNLKSFLKVVRSGQMTDLEVAMLGLDKLGLL